MADDGPLRPSRSGRRTNARSPCSGTSDAQAGWYPVPAWWPLPNHIARNLPPRPAQRAHRLATRLVSTAQLTGIPPILDEAGISNLPKARVAVLDGIALAPSQELLKSDGQKVTTLWGELAWQLLGDQGLALVRDADAEGTSPGKKRLKYMAIVIHRLWTANNRDALIMPGSIALGDANVRNKSIH